MIAKPLLKYLIMLYFIAHVLKSVSICDHKQIKKTTIITWSTYNDNKHTLFFFLKIPFVLFPVFPFFLLVVCFLF